MDPRETKRRQREDRARAHRLAQDWKRVLSTAEGRRVIQSLMERWGLHQRTPVGSMADTNLAIGRQGCALDLRDEVLSHGTLATLHAMEAELAARPEILPDGDDEDG